MKNSCNEKFYDETFPEKVTLDGSYDKQKCFELLQKVFCTETPTGFPCPFDDQAVNTFIPADKEKPFKVLYIGLLILLKFIKIYY